jgi:hypothetical protein
MSPCTAPIFYSRYLVKRADMDPRMQSALHYGLLGAGAGGLVQLVRKMLQSRRDEEEEGSPSLLKGMLLGGLGGAGFGAFTGGGGTPSAPADTLHAYSKYPAPQLAALDTTPIHLGAPVKNQMQMPEVGTLHSTSQPQSDALDMKSLQLGGPTGQLGGPTGQLGLPTPAGMPPKLTRSGQVAAAPAAHPATLTSLPEDDMTRTLRGMRDGSLPPGLKHPSLQARISEKAHDLGTGLQDALKYFPETHEALMDSQRKELDIQKLLEAQRAAGKPSLFDMP